MRAYPRRNAGGTPQPVQAADLETTRAILERRLSERGVPGAEVRVAEDDRLVVTLPGVADPDALVSLVAASGELEFIEAGNTPLTVGELVCTTAGCPTPLQIARRQGGNLPPPGATADPATLNLHTYPVVVAGDQVDGNSLRVDSEPTLGQPVVAFKLRAAGQEQLAAFTRTHIGQFMPIVLDKVVLSSPTIQSEIPHGEGVISGLSKQEADDLVLKLRAGALPVGLDVESVRILDVTPGAAPK